MAVDYWSRLSESINDLGDAARAFMYEAGGELQTMAQRTVRVDTGQTKGSYTYEVHENGEQIECTFGSTIQNGIYEEYGTGEYALKGDGRKTPWKFKDRNGKWYRTTGKTPTRPIYTAYETLKPQIDSRLREIINRTL